jgi:hypothetical protein
MSGNPVKIGDGCATVTGYKLPLPLIHGIGKAGARFKPEVRIPIELCSSGCRQHRSVTVAPAANFSVKEKDEASPKPRVRMGIH